jgi:hypothetical protein
MNATTLPEISQNETTVLRLTAEQLLDNAVPSSGSGRVAFLEAGGLGEPLRLTLGDAPAVDQIILRYEAAGARFERSWIEATRTDESSYYRLTGDSSSVGYISA